MGNVTELLIFIIPSSLTYVSSLSLLSFSLFLLLLNPPHIYCYHNLLRCPTPEPAWYVLRSPPLPSSPLCIFHFCSSCEYQLYPLVQLSPDVCSLAVSLHSFYFVICNNAHNQYYLSISAPNMLQAFFLLL